MRAPGRVAVLGRGTRRVAGAASPCNSLALSTGVPFRATMVSPGCVPACAAAPVTFPTSDAAASASERALTGRIPDVKLSLPNAVICLLALVALAVRGEDAETDATPEAEDTREKVLPTPSNVEQGGENAAIKRFQVDMVRAVGRMVSERDYPREARERGWQGTTTVRVEIGPDGLLKAATVTRSSGYAILDDQALSTVRSVPSPEIPAELREHTFSVEIPFRFSLRMPTAESRGSPEQNPATQPDVLKRFGVAVANRAGLAVSAGDYPLEARRKGWEGLAMVRLRFEADGLLKDVTVAQSSGYAVLDQYAVSKIRAVTLPDVPEELRGRAFNVTVPFQFQLQQPATDEGGAVRSGPRPK